MGCTLLFDPNVHLGYVWSQIHAHFFIKMAQSNSALLCEKPKNNLNCLVHKFKGPLCREFVRPIPRPRSSTTQISQPRARTVM
jgi:hypothetical protein